MGIALTYTHASSKVFTGFENFLQKPEISNHQWQNMKITMNKSARPRYSEIRRDQLPEVAQRRGTSS